MCAGQGGKPNTSLLLIKNKIGDTQSTIISFFINRFWHKNYNFGSLENAQFYKLLLLITYRNTRKLSPKSAVKTEQKKKNQKQINQR